MTPARARELRIHWMQQVSPGERSYDQMIEKAILAACAEELQKLDAVIEAAKAMRTPALVGNRDRVADFDAALATLEEA